MFTEINNLLHDVIKQCTSDTGKTEKKAERSNKIITGNTVQLGCVFKKKSNSHDLLLGEGSDDESPSRSLYGQKLIVYVCPIEPGSPNSRSELCQAMARGESGRKMVKISTYFSKAGGSGTQGSKAGGSGTQGSGPGAAQSATSSSSSSQDQKEVIRNIIKRGKMSKHSKKVKSSSRKREEQCKLQQREDLNKGIADHKEKRTSTDDNITCSINNPTSTKFSPTSSVIDIDSDKDTEILDAPVSQYSHTNQTDNLGEKRGSMASEKIGNSHGTSALGTITLCDVSSSQKFQPSDEPTITVYSAEQIQELNLTVLPSACLPDTSVTVDTTEPVATTANLSSEEFGQGNDSNDSILPSYSFIQQKTDSRPSGDDHSHLDTNKNYDADSDTLFDQYSDIHVDLDSIRSVASDSDSSSDDDRMLTRRRKSSCKMFEGRGSPLDKSVTNSDSGACLIALKRRMTKKRVLPDLPLETNRDEEIPNKRQKCASEAKSSKTDNETFDSDVQTSSTTFKSSSVVELPSLIRSRKSKTCRAPKEMKQATLTLTGGSLAVTKTRDTQPCVSQQDREDCMIVDDDQASERLKSELRREIIHTESVKDLNEQHVWFLVKENRQYLQGIFEGKIPCERHKQFKQGGKTRYRLNYQVYLSLFTDEQQDVVMEALMSIFCKKNHGFLDYVMKVMLPEMLIKLYMEVTGLDHDEVDDIMARGGR